MNWKTFKEMPLADKLKWVIHYYGIAICVGIVAICVIITLLGRMLGPGEEYAARIMILDDRCSDEERIQMGEELQAQLGLPCEVIAYHKNDENQFQAFAVRLTGAELDMIIAPEKEMKELESNGYFQEMHKMKEDASYYQMTDPEGNYPDKDLYLGITDHMEKEIAEKVNMYFESK